MRTFLGTPLRAFLRSSLRASLGTPMTTAALTLLLGASVLGSAAATAPVLLDNATAYYDPDQTLSARVVTTFDPGEMGAFGESMVADARGGLIVTMTRWGDTNTGQLYRVAVDGTTTEFGPSMNLGECSLITGVTLDPAGRVLAAVANYNPACSDGSPANGVLAVSESSVTRVLTMPSGTFANGVVTHRGTVYVTDSYSGSVWAGSADRETAPTQPWFSSRLLAPTKKIGLGANGITVHEGRLYVTGYAKGYVLSVGIDTAGQPRGARVYAHDTRLLRADGIAFDERGRLWVAVNPEVDDDAGTQAGEGWLLVVRSDGSIRTVPTPVGSLDYPTEPVHLDRSVFVLNGSYLNGTPFVVQFTRQH